MFVKLVLDSGGKVSLESFSKFLNYERSLLFVLYNQEDNHYFPWRILVSHLTSGSLAQLINTMAQISSYGRCI